MNTAFRMTVALALLAIAAAPAPAQVRAGFVMTMGRDTVAVERFERAGSQVTGVVLFRLAQLRTDYVLELRDDETVRTLLVDARKATDPADSPPLQSATATFDDDSVRTEIRGGRRDVMATLPRSLPYLNPSMLLFEQIARRARVVGGARAIVPLFMVAGGQTLECFVTRVGADSLVLTLGGLDIRLAVDREGNLLGGAVPAQGTRFTRVSELPDGALVQAKADYSAPPGAAYTAEEVRVRTRGGFDLAGTLTRPAGVTGRVGAVVTITGSGSQERDESLPFLRGYRPMRQVAESLAARGIATLRLDDRGAGASGGSAARSTTADHANDIEDAVAWLRARPDVDGDRIALVGHSEGGLIAPMLAARDSRLRAIVLMAGTAERGSRVLDYQRRQSVERHTPKGARRDSVMRVVSESADSLIHSNPWLAWFADYDPLPVLRDVRQSVLVLQGATDRQVTAEQAGRIEKALRAGGNRDVTRRVFADTNHLFVPDPDGSPEGYSSLDDPDVRREVLGTMAQWLAERIGPARAR